MRVPKIDVPPKIAAATNSPLKFSYAWVTWVVKGGKSIFSSVSNFVVKRKPREVMTSRNGFITKWFSDKDLCFVGNTRGIAWPHVCKWMTYLHAFILFWGSFNHVFLYKHIWFMATPFSLNNVICKLVLAKQRPNFLLWIDVSCLWIQEETDIYKLVFRTSWCVNL